MVEGGPRDKTFILSQSERAVLGTGPPSRSREGTLQGGTSHCPEQPQANWEIAQDSAEEGTLTLG